MQTDKPNTYLTEDDAGILTAQITRLLRDEETDNCALVLELIEGGGANRRLIGYLFAIAVFHHQKDVSERARKLLQRWASAETVKQALKLREGAAYYYNEVEYLGKYRNPEFDLFDFLLAGKMCYWHRTSANRSPYAVVTHHTLNLTHYPEPVFSPALATLDFVRYLSLPANKDFNLEQSVEHLKALPLESVFSESVRFDVFPTVLFELPRLRTLSIKRGNHRPRYPMQVPGQGPYGSISLEKLIVDGYPIAGESQLGPFPNLREASLVRCSLKHLDFLQKSPLLEHLNARFNALETAPSFISTFTELRTIELSGNPLQLIELDLTRLEKLEELEIKVQRRR